MEWNHLFIAKLQEPQSWSLRMDNLFHLTINCAHDYLSMLELKLIEVDKNGPLPGLKVLNKGFFLIDVPTHIDPLLLSCCKWFIIKLWTLHFIGFYSIQFSASQFYQYPHLMISLVPMKQPRINGYIYMNLLKTIGCFNLIRLHSSFFQFHCPDGKIMGPTWGPPGSCRPLVGPMYTPRTLLSGW